MLQERYLVDFGWLLRIRRCLFPRPMRPSRLRQLERLRIRIRDTGIPFAFRLTKLCHNFGTLFLWNLCNRGNFTVGCPDLSTQDFFLRSGYCLLRSFHTFCKLLCTVNITFGCSMFRSDLRPWTVLCAVWFILNQTTFRCQSILIAVKRFDLLFRFCLLSDQELFLFWGQVSPPKLIFADPDDCFLTIWKIFFVGTERNLRMFFAMVKRLCPSTIVPFQRMMGLRIRPSCRIFVSSWFNSSNVSGGIFPWNSASILI